MIASVLGFFYVITLVMMSVYGLMGLLTLALYWQHRDVHFPTPTLPDEPPVVTVQLPIYNEGEVVQGLVETAVSLHYPRHRLQIQLIDDSNDETATMAAQLVESYQTLGINIQHVRRPHRHGYKAGALAQAMSQARGEFIAIFDADFRPKPDFLQQTIPHFLDNQRLGMVQTRWGHINHEQSALTAAQAIALDKHFAMEQTVRHRANLFPKFNGAGGVWRRTCMEESGGWQADTVCEDLCLSTRAILQGWDFRFLNEITSPAHLPDKVTAYKIQQARWSKGSLQCLHKFGKDILTAKEYSLMARLYALLSMSGYINQPLLLLLLILQVSLLALDYNFSAWLIVFSLAGIGQPLLFILGQQVLYPDWQKRLRYFPFILLVSIGLAPNNARAIWQAFFGKHHPFKRTPKSSKYRIVFDPVILAELFFMIYAGIGICLAVYQHIWGMLFFLTTAFLGFLYVFTLSVKELLDS